ncbi:MAG TPA: hypothetical protein VGA80_11805 [Flavobacteriaceae bacterium]|jgi:hypothetical protein
MKNNVAMHIPIYKNIIQDHEKEGSLVGLGEFTNTSIIDVFCVVSPMITSGNLITNLSGTSAFIPLSLMNGNRIENSAVINK